MKKESIIKKLNYYSKWLMSMTDEQINSEIGKWVAERCDIYFAIVTKDHSQSQILSNA